MRGAFWFPNRFHPFAGMNFVRVAVNAGLVGLAGYRFVHYVMPDAHAQLPAKKLDDPMLLREVETIARALGVENLDRLHLFVYGGYSPRSHGYVGSPGGAFLTIPEFYVRGHVYPGKSRFGWDEQLYRTLRPDDATRRFNLAHEISHVKRGDSLISDSIMFGLGGLIVNARSRYLQVSSGPAIARLLLLLALSATFSVSASRFYLRWAEFKADKDAANLGEAFAKGGVQFCDKLVLARRLLHKELKYGSLTFSHDGEVRLTFYPSAAERRHRLRRIYKQLAVEQQDDASAGASKAPS